ncbi:signal peptidase I [Clostridiaceae bacterium 35-E11]
MIRREKFLPTRSSKARCIFVIGLMICLYLFESSSIASLLGRRIFNYIVKPMLWLGLAYIIWLFPKARTKGQLKLKNLLNWWAFNFGVIYIIVFVLAGVVDGFGKSPYSHAPLDIMINILFVGAILVGREMARSYLVNNLTEDENFILFVMVALFMTGISMSFHKFNNIKDYVEITKFVAQYVAPEFAQNLLATYLVFLGGPLSAIIYLSIVQGFQWLSPILPDLQWITTALIGVLVPVFCLMAIQGIYVDAAKERKERDKKGDSVISWMITSILSITMIWFAVGVFPTYPSVIATGSMEPMIKPGDVILVKKINGDAAKIGDVIQFKREGILISHRVIDIKKGDQGTRYRTKGDNNSAADTVLVNPEEIKGKVIYVVPNLGWPTLLIKSKENIPLEEIQF